MHLFISFFLLMTFALAQAPATITVNGVALDQDIIDALASYGVQLGQGDFWYNPESGLWGFWGGPALGQLYPGLQLGGALAWDASGGQTNVFVNGRALHPSEVQYLQGLYGFVVPGRYTFTATGDVSLEGGFFLFNVNASRYSQNGQSWYKGFIGQPDGMYMGGEGSCVWAQVAGESYLSGGC